MWQTQGHRDVADPAVYPNHPRTSRQALCEFHQIATRPNDRTRAGTGHGLRRLQLGIAGMGQGQLIALRLQGLTQNLPMCEWPGFVCTGTAMHQGHSLRKHFGVRRGLQTRLNQSGQCIAQGLGAHMAATV